MKKTFDIEFEKKIYNKNTLFKGFISFLCILPLCLFGCLDTDKNIITENPVSYESPVVNTLSAPYLTGTSITITWETNKSARGLIQISEDDETTFEPEHTTSGRSVLIIPNYYNNNYPGHYLDNYFNPVNTIKKDETSVYNSLSASTASNSFPYYTIENLTTPFPVAKSMNITSSLLDIYYLHNVNYTNMENKICSESIYKHSLSTATLDKNKLSSEEQKIFNSLTSWSLGIGTHTSNYISNQAYFDINMLINAGAVYSTELISANFFSNNGGYGKNHKVTIKGLSSSKKYYYRIVSVDAWGKIWKSDKKEFMPQNSSRVYSSKINATGNEIKTLSGATLKIPANDLISEITISISEYDTAQPGSENMAFDGKMYYIGPGNTFTKADLTLTATKNINSELYLWSLENGYQKVTSQSKINNLVTGKILKPGFYTLINLK